MMEEKQPGSSLSISDTVSYIWRLPPLFCLLYQLSIEQPPFQKMTPTLPKVIPPTLNPKRFCLFC